MMSHQATLRFAYCRRIERHCDSLIVFASSDIALRLLLLHRATLRFAYCCRIERHCASLTAFASSDIALRLLLSHQATLRFACCCRIERHCASRIADMLNAGWSYKSLVADIALRTAGTIEAQSSLAPSRMHQDTRCIETSAPQSLGR
jgi:hypothetical protein